MKPLQTLVTLVFLGALPGSVTATETSPDRVAEPREAADLSEFLWTKRPIVVFADSDQDPRFVEQMKFLDADPDALALRDVVVLTDTDPAARGPLRATLRPRGFALVLIDKDGEVKLRKPAPWSTREITRTIDKWPTRQQEIREKLGKE